MFPKSILYFAFHYDLQSILKDLNGNKRNYYLFCVCVCGILGSD